MEIQELLVELGGHLNIPNLTFGAYGVCKIDFEDQYSICIEHNDAQELFHIYAQIGNVPYANPQPFYEKLLERNLFGAQTHQWTLAVDRSCRELLLSGCFKSSFFSKHEFVKYIETFQDYIAISKEWLKLHIYKETDNDVNLDNEQYDFNQSMLNNHTMLKI